MTSFGLRSLLMGSLLLATPAVAQPVPRGQEGALAGVLAPKHEASVCYARTYDAAHLKQHPQQKTTQVLFRLRYFDHRQDKDDPMDQQNYYFTLGVKQKGRAKLLRADGECSATATGFRCGVECDGGGVTIAPDANAATLLIDLGRDGRIRMTQGCDEETNAVELTPGADDQSFRVSRVDAGKCREIAK